MTNKHDSAIIFLYTGEYGIVTDSSGLYYMRARYYDPMIKRFINQDVLTGSITDSPTLNRYAYVNGNPISLSDPFGLSPILNWLGDINGHRVLDLLGMIPGAGFVFDIANAIWYANEGNTKEALLSLASALPGAGDAIGAISKGSKMLNMINKACHVFGYGANLYYASDNLIKDAKNIAQSIENGDGVSLGQVFNLAVSAAGISHSAKGLQNSLNSCFYGLQRTKKCDYKSDFDDLAEYRKKQKMPERGSVDDKHTAAKLIIGDNEYYGKNAHGFHKEVRQTLNVNPITATHAEAEVFYKAKMDNINSKTATLIIDRPACKACGINGGIRNMSKQLGVEELTVIMPNSSPIVFNPQFKPEVNPFM